VNSLYNLLIPLTSHNTVNPTYSMQWFINNVVRMLHCNLLHTFHNHHTPNSHCNGIQTSDFMQSNTLFRIPSQTKRTRKL